MAPVSSSSSSSVPWFFSPSLQPHYRPSSLLWLLLTSPAFSRKRSPQVRCRICLLVPPGSTGCVLMTFGLRCSGPARRPHSASLPVCVPTVEGLPSASFSFASRLRLAVRLQLPSSAPIGSFHPIRFCPCWAHPAAGSLAGFPTTSISNRPQINKLPHILESQPLAKSPADRVEARRYSAGIIFNVLFSCAFSLILTASPFDSTGFRNSGSI